MHSIFPSKKHEIECLNSLPAPEASDDDERDGEMPAKRARLDSDVAAKASCDSCKNNSSAVCFCVDCGKKLCSRHEEVMTQKITDSCCDVFCVHKLEYKINSFQTLSYGLHG